MWCLFGIGMKGDVSMNMWMAKKWINYMNRMTEMAFKWEKPPKNIHILENIYYIEDGTEQHKLDILYPDIKQELYPVIVNIHGGAFCMNSKDNIYRNYGIRLAGNKYAVVNINYRLSLDAVFPAQVEDVISAIHFIWKNADMYHLDRERLFVSGDSAGAYLAAMAGCVSSHKRLQKYYGWNTDIHIRGLGLCCGMYDFESYLKTKVIFPLKRTSTWLLFGTKDITKADAFTYSSVLKHINENFPPTYIMETEMNSFVEEALRMEKILKKKNVAYKIHIYPKKDKLMHAFHVMDHYKEGDEVLKEMWDFLATGSSTY